MAHLCKVDDVVLTFATSLYWSMINAATQMTYSQMNELYGKFNDIVEAESRLNAVSAARP